MILWPKDWVSRVHFVLFGSWDNLMRLFVFVSLLLRCEYWTGAYFFGAARPIVTDGGSEDN